MSEQNEKPTTMDNINDWLTANGLDRPLALMKLAQQGEVGLAHAVDPDHGAVFLLAMIPANLLMSLPEQVRGDAALPPGLPVDALVPLPVAQVLTAAQSKQVSMVGQAGRLVLFEASLAAPSPNPAGPQANQ